MNKIEKMIEKAITGESEETTSVVKSKIDFKLNEPTIVLLERACYDKIMLALNEYNCELVLDNGNLCTQTKYRTDETLPLQNLPMIKK